MRACSVMSNFFATAWTVTHPAPLSMEFSRQEYWSGLPFPFPGDLPRDQTQISCIEEILYRLSHQGSPEGQLVGQKKSWLIGIISGSCLYHQWQVFVCGWCVTVGLRAGKHLHSGVGMRGVRPSWWSSWRQGQAAVWTHSLGNVTSQVWSERKVCSPWMDQQNIPLLHTALSSPEHAPNMPVWPLPSALNQRTMGRPFCCVPGIRPLCR